MTLTRIDAETKLVGRCGKKMALVGFSVAFDGSNPDLVDPMQSALIDLGKQPDSFSAVTNEDLAKISASQVSEFLDRAELRLLENISGNLDQVNISVGPRDEDLSDLASQVERAIDRLITKISKQYGNVYNSNNELSGSSLKLDFQEKES